MLHRSRTNFFPVRLSVFFQPVPPSSSGESGPPDTLDRGGIDSLVTPRPPSDKDEEQHQRAEHADRRGSRDRALPDLLAGLGRLLLRLVRLVLKPQLPGRLGRLAFRLGRLALQPRGQLAQLLLCLRLHVRLGGEGFHRLAEPLTGLLDFLLQLLLAVRRRGHRCIPSFTSSISALVPSTACSGMGGVARRILLLPISAATALTTTSTSPTISAASHGRISPAIAMITAASRHAMAYKATSPLAPYSPMPKPANFPLRASSSLAIFSSSRTSADTCSDSCFTSSPVDASRPGGVCAEFATIRLTAFPSRRFALPRHPHA